MDQELAVAGSPAPTRREKGIKTCVKADIQCTAADLVLGTTLRLPGEFFMPRIMDSIGIQDYMQRLSTFMQSLSPAQTRIQQRKVFIPTDLFARIHSN
ncbi:unnamed protein product [Echinostoma caproni]|uniref:Uncharacterized protein n=1 Tax=Echinostoma caproni TaxID=27848 RepID=A0A183AWV2_9TREM|nr:unnamed protein product [Echinostoma caproni]